MHLKAKLGMEEEEMKANINLEIDKEDLTYELKDLVSRIASDEIRRMVKETAKQLVQEEVKRIIAPIVDDYLDTAKVGREHISYHDKTPSRRNVDEYIKSIISAYLDEPVYLYSKDSETLSRKYAISSSPGDKTRAEHWVIDKSKKYMQEVVLNKIDKMAKQMLPNEERIQELIKAELKKIVG